jgi:hypothetical protein
LKPVIIPKTITTPLPIVLPKNKPFPQKQEQKQNSFGFDVFVKRKGKLKKANKNPLTKRAAFALGQKVTDVTAARSFEVLPSFENGTPQELPFASFNQSHYYKSKRTGLLVELPKYSINTAGERKEITYQGIAANKLPAWLKTNNSFHLSKRESNKKIRLI